MIYMRLIMCVHSNSLENLKQEEFVNILKNKEFILNATVNYGTYKYEIISRNSKLLNFFSKHKINYIAINTADYIEFSLIDDYIQAFLIEEEIINYINI